MSNFNFTGRQKILHDDLRVTIDSSGGKAFYQLDLKLGDYKLSADANVFVEPERSRAQRIRHNWGTIGAQSSTEWKLGRRFDISEMGDLEGVRFRIIVAEPSTCRILAMAERIHPKNSDDSLAPQSSLLPVRMADLGGGFWELDYESGGPILTLDVGLGSKQDLKNNQIFMSVVMPGIVRSILTTLAHEHLGEGDGDEGASNVGDANGAWLKLGLRWAGYLPAAKHDEIDIWAQKAMNSFYKDKKLRDKIRSALTEE